MYRDLKPDNLLVFSVYKYIFVTIALFYIVFVVLRCRTTLTSIASYLTLAHLELYVPCLLFAYFLIHRNQNRLYFLVGRRSECTCAIFDRHRVKKKQTQIYEIRKQTNPAFFVALQSIWRLKWWTRASSEYSIDIRFRFSLIVFPNFRYNCKVDVYSFAMLAWELMAEKQPFHEVKTKNSFIKWGKRNCKRIIGETSVGLTSHRCRRFATCDRWRGIKIPLIDF